MKKTRRYRYDVLWASVKSQRENENSAGNFNSVTINWVQFYFSYETCISENHMNDVTYMYIRTFDRTLQGNTSIG